MDLSLIATSFVLIFITELGDKTMFASLTLATRYPRKQVFVGTVLALAVLTGLGIIIGGALARVVPSELLRIGAGMLFIGIGVYAILIRDKEVRPPGLLAGRWGGLLASFSMIALMELGDKSQLTVIALTMEGGQGLPVLIGAMLAFAVITAIGVTVGNEMGKRLREDLIRLVAGAVFITIGLLLLLETII